MKPNTVLSWIAMAVALTAHNASAIPQTYPGPSGISGSNKYSVSVNGQSSFVYETTDQQGTSATASYTYFDFDTGPVTVQVTNLSGAISSIAILPYRLNISATISGNTATFVLNQPQKISVEINGTDPNDALFIFAQYPEAYTPTASAPGLIYIGPGVTNLGSNYVIPDNTTLYLAGGAYVNGTINMTGGSNIAIKGRGILSGRNYPHVNGPGLVVFYDCLAVTVQGITLVDSPGWFVFTKTTSQQGAVGSGNHDMFDQSPTVYNVFRDFNEIGWWDNTDGIHPGRKAIVDNVFIFNHDDGIKIAEDEEELRLTNSIIWNHYGGALTLDWTTFYDCGNASISNIDVIHYDGNTAVIWSPDAGGGFIGNVLVDGINVDQFGSSSSHTFIDLELAENPYSLQPGVFGQIANVFINNASVPGDLAADTLYGYDPLHIITNVTFNNFSVGGTVVTDTGGAKLSTNAYTGNIAVTVNGSVPLPYLALSDSEIINDSVGSTGTAAFNYQGSAWGYNNYLNNSSWHNDFHYDNGVSDSFTIPFNGTTVEWVGRMGPDFGIAAVSLDGGPATPVDLYSPSNLFLVALYSTGNLPSGRHTLQVQNTGTHNPASTNIWMTNDAIRFRETEPSVTIYEAENGIPGGGAFTNYNRSGFLGTGYMSGFWQNSTASVELTVNAPVAGYYTLDSHYSAGYGTASNMALYINGVQITIPTFPATADWNTWSDEYEVVELNRGLNKITYQNLFTANAVINLDYIQISPESVDQTVNDTDSSITYDSTWIYAPSRPYGDFQNDVHSTNVSGGTATIRFTGVAFVLLSEMNVDMGSISVALDGGPPKIVTCYNPLRLPQQPVSSFTQLANTSHTVTVTNLSGSYGIIDAYLYH